MPQWLVSMLIPFVVKLLKSYAIPAIEAKWPSFIPIIEEILSLMGQGSSTSPSTNPPSPMLRSAANHYNDLCSGTACPAKPVGLS